MAFLQLFWTIFGFVTSYWWTILLGILVYGWYKVYWKFYNRKFPPGPTGIPLIGYLGPGWIPFTGQYWAEQGIKYKSKTTSVRMFGIVLVIINDYDLAKEYFGRNFADRADIMFNTITDPDYKGIISTSGQLWKAQRRFTMRIMRDLGMGKILGEQNIQTEAQKAIAAFEKLCSEGLEAFDPRNITNMAVSNIINGIVFGKQFEYTDQRFIDVLRNMNQWFTELTNPKNSLLYFPLARLIMRKTMNRLVGFYNHFSNFVIEEIEEHQKSFDGEVKDLIDAYLQEMQEKTDSDDEIFNIKQLRYLVMDLFFAGSETTYSTLLWFFQYMAKYQDVQEKVYQELKDVVGERPVSMHDKPKTPYTDAVACEIQRMTTLANMTLVHSNMHEDCELDGYILPANTPVLANLHQVHRDPRFWKNPEEFDPNNFLDEEGNMLSTEKLVPFSIDKSIFYIFRLTFSVTCEIDLAALDTGNLDPIPTRIFGIQDLKGLSYEDCDSISRHLYLGRRSCAGEALAKMELYILFATWIKHFQIKPETDDTDIQILPYLGETGGLNSPKPFKIRMIPRN